MPAMCIVDAFMEAFALEILHGDEDESALSLAKLVGSNDVWVGKATSNLYLGSEALQLCGICEEFWFEDFQGTEFVVERFVSGRIDRTHPSRTNLAIELVSTRDPGSGTDTKWFIFCNTHSDYPRVRPVTVKALNKVT